MVTGMSSVGGGLPWFFGRENVLFWTDLSAAGLIEGSFNDNSDDWVEASTDAQFAAEMPRAKIGNGNFIWVNGVYYGVIPSAPTVWRTLTMNGFQIIEPLPISGGIVGINSGLTPLEDYNMDKKVDDGLPLSGKVIAMYGSDWGSPGIEILYSDTPSLCVLPGPPVTYNIGTPAVSNTYQCSLRFNASW